MLCVEEMHQLPAGSMSRQAAMVCAGWPHLQVLQGVAGGAAEHDLLCRSTCHHSLQHATMSPGTLLEQARQGRLRRCSLQCKGAGDRVAGRSQCMAQAVRSQATCGCVQGCAGGGEAQPSKQKVATACRLKSSLLHQCDTGSGCAGTAHLDTLLHHATGDHCIGLISASCEVCP